MSISYGTRLLTVVARAESEDLQSFFHRARPRPPEAWTHNLHLAVLGRGGAGGAGAVRAGNETEQRENKRSIDRVLPFSWEERWGGLDARIAPREVICTWFALWPLHNV